MQKRLFESTIQNWVDHFENHWIVKNLYAANLKHLKRPKTATTELVDRMKYSVLQNPNRPVGKKSVFRNTL